MDRISHDFSMTISIKKTKVIGQDIGHLPEIKVNDHKLDDVQEFTYLGSTVSGDISSDTEINRHIGRAWSPSSNSAHSAGMDMSIVSKIVESHLDLLYGELAKGKRACERPHLHFRNVRIKCILMSIGGRTWPSTETCEDRSKRHLKSVDIDVDRWEDLAID